MRGKYAHALLSGQVHLPAGIKADIQPPCVGHCSAEQGAVPPSSWCRHQLLLSLPGVSFAVGAFLAAHADAVPVAYGARRLYLARAPAAPLLFQIFRSFCGATAARRRVDVDSVCTTRAGTGPGGADVLFVRDGADPGSL